MNISAKATEAEGSGEFLPLRLEAYLQTPAQAQRLVAHVERWFDLLQVDPISTNIAKGWADQRLEEAVEALRDHPTNADPADAVQCGPDRDGEAPTSAGSDAPEEPSQAPAHDVEPDPAAADDGAGASIPPETSPPVGSYDLVIQGKKAAPSMPWSLEEPIDAVLRTAAPFDLRPGVLAPELKPKGKRSTPSGLTVSDLVDRRAEAALNQPEEKPAAAAPRPWALEEDVRLIDGEIMEASVATIVRNLGRPWDEISDRLDVLTKGATLAKVKAQLRKGWRPEGDDNAK